MSALNSSSFATVFQKPRQCLNSFRSLSTSRATFSILLWFVACHASTFTRGTPSRRTRALSASSFALSSHVSSNVVAFLRAPTKSLPMFVLATLRSLISCFALSRCPRALGKAVIGTLGFPRSAEPSGPTDRGAQIPICTAGARFAAPCITTEIRKFFPRLDLCNTAKFLRNIPEYFGIFRNLPEYFGIFRNISEEPRKHETNSRNGPMNDDVATIGHSAPNWHEHPQWYMTKDRQAISCRARTDVADVNSR